VCWKVRDRAPLTARQEVTMTQRIPAFIIVFTALIGLTGCGLFGGSKTSTPAPSAASEAPAERAAPAEAEDDAPDEDLEVEAEPVDTGSN
jgi:hypothetical protein